MEKEIWKDIENFEGLYQISSIGRIKGRGGKILSPFVNERNYLKIGLSKNGEKKNYFVHKLVAEAYVPNPNNYPEVDHIDGNKQNNAVENLRWVDHSTNCLNPNTNFRFYKKMWGGTKIV